MPVFAIVPPSSAVFDPAVAPVAGLLEALTALSVALSPDLFAEFWAEEFWREESALA